MLVDLSATEWQKFGKIGIHAFKSQCLKKFKICETDPPRILDSTFLPIVENKTASLGTYDGTCAMITYQLKDKVFSDIKLVEIPCAESIAAYFCEVK
jgi:hypothetical protein